MKKALYLLFLFLTAQVFAQEGLEKPEVFFGKIHKDPPRTYLFKMLGQHNKLTYFMRSERKYNGSLFIEAYDDSLNLVSSNPITGANEDLLFERCFLIDGKFYMFLTYIDKDAETNTIYGTTFDINGKLDIGNLRKLGDLPIKNKRNIGTFSVDTARGAGAKTFLIYEQPYFQKKENENFNFIVYDQSFKLIQKISFKLPYKDLDVHIKNFILDNKGNIHVLASVELDENEQERGKQDYEIKVFSYFSKENNLKEQVIDVGENYLSDVHIQINKDNDLVLTGFYADRSATRMEGVFFVKISTEKESIVKQKVTSFDKAFLEQFMSEKKVNKGKSLYNNYYVDKVLPKGDGGITMVAEYYNTYTTCYQDPNTGMTICSTHYLYNDIILVDLDIHGNVLWWVKIPKKQHTINDGGNMSSYALCRSSNNDINIIFNDNPANLKIDDPRKIKNMKSPRKSVTNLVTVNSKGEMTKSTLFNTKENKVVMKPLFHLQPSPNELIMYANQWKSYMLARIKF